MLIPNDGVVRLAALILHAVGKRVCVTLNWDRGCAATVQFIVSVNNPEETQRALLEAFRNIETAQRPCGAPVPQAPLGRVFEKENIAVSIGSNDGGH